MFATKKKPSSSQHQNTVSFEDDNFGTQETNEEVGGEQQPAKEKCKWYSSLLLLHFATHTCMCSDPGGN